jgi:hypothetical protein
MSEVNTKAVQQGLLNGKIVWICDYSQPDLNKKPLRNVKPTKCIVVCNGELPKNKTIYYSESHYRALNKKGEPVGRPISPVDNTGFRSHQGSPLNTFEKKDDCIRSWNGMLSEVHKRLQDKLENAEETIKIEIDKINSMVVFI